MNEMVREASTLLKHFDARDKENPKTERSLGRVDTERDLPL
jgi:hypothetical protein